MGGGNPLTKVLPVSIDRYNEEFVLNYFQTCYICLIRYIFAYLFVVHKMMGLAQIILQLFQLAPHHQRNPLPHNLLVLVQRAVDRLRQQMHQR